MRRTQTQAAETRSAILDAAETVFQARGVSASTLADIAQTAGVTRGAVYWHFAGKIDVFEAVCERVKLPAETFLREQSAAGGGVATLADLEALMLVLVRRFLADERAQRVYEIILLRCEFVGELDASLARHRASESAFDAAVAAALRRSAGELGLGWREETAAAALRCAVMGVFAEWLRQDRGFDCFVVAASLLSGLFAGFRRTRSCAPARGFTASAAAATPAP